MYQYIIGGLVGGIISYFGIYKNRKNIIKFWFGKRVVIFGGIETGKTTLHKFLREGEIVKTHNATRRLEKQKKNVFKLEELKLRIRKGHDVSGQKDFVKDWKLLFENCDICFYMIDCYKVNGNDSDYLKTIKFHLTHIQKWQQEFENSPEIIIIGGFCDMIEEFNIANSSNIQHVEENLRRKFKDAYLKLNISPSSIFFGSLKNEESLSKLMKEILEKLNK
jgi:signal recognition particle receptor subunit beta